MAKWWLNGRNASIILTPKVASSSLRTPYGDHEHREHDRVGVWVRHPLDRIASVLSHKRTVEVAKTDLFDNPCDDHYAPQVDYLNWRYHGGIGTHVKIPVGADSLTFVPDAVFFYENINEDHMRMVEWGGFDKHYLPHLNRHKGDRNYQSVLGKLKIYKDRFAKDIAVYERLKKDYGSN